jgi:hypothetical protein
MIEQHEFSLKNITETIGGVERTLDFGKDEGKLFRYKDFSAIQAERFGIKLLAYLPKDSDIKEIQENSSAYDASIASLMKSPEYQFLINSDCIDFLNSELKRFELYNKAKDIYEPLDIQRMENGEQIEEIATFTYLRTKLIEVYSRFFTKGNS